MVPPPRPGHTASWRCAGSSSRAAQCLFGGLKGCERERCYTGLTQRLAAYCALSRLTQFWRFLNFFRHSPYRLSSPYGCVYNEYRCTNRFWLSLGLNICMNLINPRLPFRVIPGTPYDYLFKILFSDNTRKTYRSPPTGKGKKNTRVRSYKAFLGLFDRFSSTNVRVFSMAIFWERFSQRGGRSIYSVELLGRSRTASVGCLLRSPRSRRGGRAPAAATTPPPRPG